MRNWRVTIGRRVEFFENLTPLKSYLRNKSNFQVFDLRQRVDVTKQFLPQPKPVILEEVVLEKPKPKRKRRKRRKKNV